MIVLDTDHLSVLLDERDNSSSITKLDQATWFSYVRRLPREAFRMRWNIGETVIELCQGRAELVRFVLFSEAAYGAFKAVLDELRG